MNNTLRTDIHPAARRHLPIVGNSHLCGNVPVVLIVELTYHHRVGNNNAGSIGTGTKQSQRMSGLNDQCSLRSKFFEILLDQEVLHPVLTNLADFTISNKFIGIQRDIKTEIVVNHYLKGFAFHTFATIFINRSGFQIACGTEALCRVNAGILGEAFVLEATALGLGTCWVSGTYRRKQIRLPMQENETALAVIAVGVPEKPLQAPENRRRKPLDKLMNAVPADGMMLDAAKLVQIAPSAMNMQPWRMEVLPGAFVLTISDRALLDGGIALCHAELALRGAHRWVYSAAHGGITAVAQGKFSP